MEKEKVVLAYSGGLDTSVIIPWLKENYDNLDIIACCVNVGQEDDMEFVKNKALSSGAIKVYIENAVNEFVEEYVYKGIKANAAYEGKYLLGTAYARPLIAKKLVEVAHKEGAKYIAHGCTGKGNDQVRIETGVAALDPTIKIIAPWRIWDIKSREDAIDYAETKNIDLHGITKEKIYSRDQNILHISHEGGMLENPGNEPDFEEILIMTNTVEKAPDVAEYVEIEFEKGIPVKLNNNKLNGEKMLKAPPRPHGRTRGGSRPTLMRTGSTCSSPALTCPRRQRPRPPRASRTPRRPTTIRVLRTPISSAPMPSG